MKWRLICLQGVFGLWFIVVAARLGYWQLVRAADLSHQALRQYGFSAILPAQRGTIYSSDGFPLVTNTDEYLLYFDPRRFTATSSQLSSLWNLLPASASARQALAEYAHTQYSWIALAHHLPRNIQEQIANLQLSGLGFESEPARVYPESSSSAYLTGFVAEDDQADQKGYFGLEGFYDRQLSGKPGQIIAQQDAFGRPITLSDVNRILPQPGSDLFTSIDRTVQYIAQQKLAAGLDKYQATSGTISIMETATGRILAMVSLPGYDPIQFSTADPKLFKNPIISAGYEPGSTFKVIVMSSALDAGVVTPDSICDRCTGPVTIGDAAIRSWNNQYYPDETMRDVILHSDNVGMVFVSRRLGKTKMLDYIRKYGFGQLTGIDLQEESTPLLKDDSQWYDIDWATAAFGQGIAVTRLQMLTAVNAIANGGVLVPPRIVTSLQSGSDAKNLPSPSSRRVISGTAAALMTQMMVNGVEKGEVRYYRPVGYTVAGKTGTAQVPIAGHYDKDNVIASFIGFAPADNPKFTMLITLHESNPTQWGSTTAAPLWFDIARELFRYYHIPPSPGH